MEPMLRMTASRIVLFVSLTALPAANAADWPCWRGPSHDGVSAETGWLDRWPDGGPRVLWKASVGTGFSSFAVAGGRVYTIGNEDNTDTVFCLDAATGKTLWSHAYPSDLGDKFFEGGPTSTPTVDGERVYTIGRWGDAFCFEAATGKVVWSKNVCQETGLPAPGWGLAGSPVVHGDLLLLNAGDGGLALEKATGKVAWKSAAKEPGYSTPLVVRFGDAERMLLGSGKSYVAVDPKTGAEAWRVKWVTQYGCNAADPVVDGGRVFLSTGYGKGAALLKPGAGEPEVVWQGKVMRTQMNPCVLVGGFLFGADGDAGQKGSLKCVELATGTEKWAKEGFGPGAVTVADGRLIALSEKGELSVAPASPEGFQPTARAQVLGGKCWTVPVLANGRICCRNAAGDVVCLDVKKP
jgi:outer membrane protein assembly factor BamB